MIIKLEYDSARCNRSTPNHSPPPQAQSSTDAALT